MSRNYIQNNGGAFGGERFQGQDGFIIDHQTFKSRMCSGCGQAVVLQVKQNMHRVADDGPMDQDAALKYDMLNRVH